MKSTLFAHLPFALAVAAAIACGRIWAGAANDSAAALGGKPDTTSMSKPSAAAATDDSVKARADTVKSKEPILLIQTKRDTVIVIADEHEVQKILHSISTTVKKSRIQGYGGAGGFSRRVVAFDMDPIIDLIASDPQLAGITFPSLGKGFQTLIMDGGLGYGGLGQGIRIGGGGYGCSRKYVSRPFKNKPSNPDSTVMLKMEMGYGGLLIEKAIVKDKWNIYIGSFFGGGGVSIEGTVSPTDAISAFSNKKLSDAPLEASFMAMELHGGATYTVVPWMHIGGDVNALLYYSNNGFEQGIGGSMYGLAPGFGFRFIFGNLG